ncbi:2-amino-4-hydroxy-6-hydroxymethyldihydropteridine diphosphokinase [Shimia abyssi]|uniref:2-amino-4-hydroxy-6-hydroxymethyldihydropteridine pyrophosphokinase n=1 Tax=Shimia abyssi TaxID=1662395 RepID=A0A2P8F805_9RHOB|nr:2-amino-4-hydroxy-6-hydroxymethyldihydropteridine diphosphokinase [Shimia abyssi]PSL17854.1 2-amino-4-hydroxy-6-hydroxymethyldihydropteridine diphosphokinase [Shimia abyssi]
MNETCLLALGGNLTSPFGEPVETISEALKHLNKGAIKLLAVSRFFQTPCFPAGAGPDYVNAAVVVRTALDPHALLMRLHEIEAVFGRERVQRWGMRTLDIDLIAFGQRVLPDQDTQIAWQQIAPDAQTSATPSELILPHPRLQDRAFVLGPLCDVSPTWVHPLLGRTLAEIYSQLPQSERDALVSL